MNRLVAFEAFVAAVQAGSLSAAAARLGTTKSNVSRRIAELEAHLGVRLLNRNPRGLSTTDVGAEFYEHLNTLLGELRSAEQLVSDRSAEPRGVLRISAPASFGTLHLKTAAVALMEQYPELILDIDLDDRIVDIVTNGYDCAVRLGRLQDSSLIARNVAANRHVICASPAYLANRGEPAHPDELAGHDGLHFSLREPHLMWQLERDGEQASYRVGFRMRSNNGEVLQEAALAGMGLAILPTFMAAPHLLSKRLRPVLTSYSLAGGTISVVFAKNKQPSVKLRALIDGMIAAFGPVPSWDRDIAHLVG